MGELIKVGQRNFRKYLASRDWGWFVLIQKTRGLIGMPNPEEELRLLEEKANETWGKYQEALQVTANLSGSMDSLKDEIKAMGKQLAEEQGNISVYTDRQAKATATKATAEADLRDAQAVLASEESSRVELAAEVKAHSGSVGVVKKEIEDIELAISKVELEKGNRDHTIKVLQDEIAEQDEVINKLNKEKKHIAETQAKSNDDMITVNEKVGHLNSVKSKLESTLDELEGGLDKEKKSRAGLEKQKRKVEGDLKMAQDGVAELERSKRDLEVTINNKDKNNAQLAAKLDDEQNLVAKAQKGIKEIQGRVEAMEEELEAERQARAKAERQRSDLAREMESLGERLNEASGATSAQVELNKKRESEVTKLRKDLEECRIQHEATLVSLKKKQADSIAEMSEQMDQLNKMKAKVNKDCSQIMAEIQDVRAATDEVGRSKASAEKSQRALAATLTDLTKKIEEVNLNLGDFEQGKRRVTAENADLLRQLQELAANASLMTKTKSALVSALDEMKAIADHEAKERVSLLGKYRNMEHMADGLKENYDEEVCSKENLARQLNKALGDADMWRQKYEIDGIAKAEELEMAKLKMQARLSEGQATIEQLGLKLQQLEKSKAKAAADAADMAQQLDQAQIMNSAMEKKAKQFDRIVGEWKGKVDGLGMDLDTAQKETRNISSELFRVKNAYDESVIQLEEVLRASLELTQVKQEIERRIAQKEEEFASTRKNFGKAIEGMQMALEAETKGKVEALRMKKKLDSDVIDLGVALEHANAANAESQRNISLIQGNIRNVQQRFEEESRAKAIATDNLISADRRANANQNALEEARTLLEQADRNRRMVEQELADTNESLSDQTCTNQAICGAKMKCEQEMGSMSHDLDEMSAEAHLSEEKAQRAMIDAARLADELRMEQEVAMGLERDKKLLEAQVKDAQNRLDEAEQNALKGGKKAMAKMETRVRELESEMDAENRRCTDAQKNLRKSERRIKELTYQQDEDRKNHERMQGLIDQLQGKIKSYKKQIEEAEEIAALNLAKYRQVQTNLAGAVERADVSEQALAKSRARSRAASIGPM